MLNPRRPSPQEQTALLNLAIEMESNPPPTQPLSALQAYLESGWNCNAVVTTARGRRSLLERAARCNWVEGVGLLLAKGARPRSACGEDVCLTAVSLGNPAMLDLLLSYGAPLANPMILRTAVERYPEIVPRLLAAGADPTANNGLALSFAAAAGNIVTLRQLLAAGANLRAAGEGALCAAAMHGKTDAVRFLLDHGVDARGKPLLHAAMSSDTGPLRAILAASDHQEGSKTSALATAARHGGVKTITEAIDILLAAGADINGGEGEVLTQAVVYGKQETVLRLIARGANPRTVDNETIQRAVKQGRSANVLIVMQAGASIEPPATALLTTALMKNHPALVHALLDAGADISAVWDELNETKKTKLAPRLDALAAAIPEHQRAHLLACSPRRLRAMMALQGMAHRRSQRKMG